MTVLQASGNLLRTTADPTTKALLSHWSEEKKIIFLLSFPAEMHGRQILAVPIDAMQYYSETGNTR